MSYNTKQKNTILDVIKKEKGCFTIKDLYNKMDKKIGLTTIYRMVDKLVQDNILTKSISNDNTTYYQYLEECSKDNHFFLKCENCGEIEHVDCDCIEELSNHISKKHEFSLTDHVIINGICKKCTKMNKR